MIADRCWYCAFGKRPCGECRKRTRVTRNRMLTPDEALKYDEIRSKVHEEHPPAKT